MHSQLLLWVNVKDCFSRQLAFVKRTTGGQDIQTLFLFQGSSCQREKSNMLSLGHGNELTTVVHANV